MEQQKYERIQEIVEENNRKERIATESCSISKGSIKYLENTGRLQRKERIELRLLKHKQEYSQALTINRMNKKLQNEIEEEKRIAELNSVHSNVKRRGEDVFLRLYEKGRVTDSKSAITNLTKDRCNNLKNSHIPLLTQHNKELKKENECVYNERENTWHNYKTLLNTFKQNTPTVSITRIIKSLIDNSKFNKESKINMKGVILKQLKDRKIVAGELEEITPYKKFQVTKRHPHILEYEAIAETADPVENKENMLRARKNESSELYEKKDVSAIKNSFINGDRRMCQKNIRTSRKEDIPFNINNL